MPALIQNRLQLFRLPVVLMLFIYLPSMYLNAFQSQGGLVVKQRWLNNSIELVIPSAEDEEIDHILMAAAAIGEKSVFERSRFKKKMEDEWSWRLVHRCTLNAAEYGHFELVNELLSRVEPNRNSVELMVKLSYASGFIEGDSEPFFAGLCQRLLNWEEFDFKLDRNNQLWFDEEQKLNAIDEMRLVRAFALLKSGKELAAKQLLNQIQNKEFHHVLTIAFLKNSSESSYDDLDLDEIAQEKLNKLNAWRLWKQSKYEEAFLLTRQIKDKDFVFRFQFQLAEELLAANEHEEVRNKIVEGLFAMYLKDGVAETRSYRFELPVSIAYQTKRCWIEILDCNLRQLDESDFLELLINAGRTENGRELISSVSVLTKQKRWAAAVVNRLLELGELEEAVALVEGFYEEYALNIFSSKSLFFGEVVLAAAKAKRYSFANEYLDKIENIEHTTGQVVVLFFWINALQKNDYMRFKLAAIQQENGHAETANITIEPIRKKFVEFVASMKPNDRAENLINGTIKIGQALDDVRSNPLAKEIIRQIVNTINPELTIRKLQLELNSKHVHVTTRLIFEKAIKILQTKHGISQNNALAELENLSTEMRVRLAGDPSPRTNGFISNKLPRIISVINECEDQGEREFYLWNFASMMAKVGDETSVERLAAMTKTPLAKSQLFSECAVLFPPNDRRLHAAYEMERFERSRSTGVF